MNRSTFTWVAMATIITSMLITTGPVTAGMITSTSFNGVASGAVSTAGALDWGYVDEVGVINLGLFDSGVAATAAYTNTPFASVYRPVTTTPLTTTVITTVDATAAIGVVTLTENGDVIAGQSNTSNYTFDGNAAYGSYGGLAVGEDNVWTMTFNDLGVGTFTMTIYMGHTQTNRSFAMDAVLSDGGPVDTDTIVSGAISGLAGATVASGSGGRLFTYNITVTTTSATEDLSLTFGSTAGGTAGGAFLSGYTVAGTLVVVPTPAALPAGLAMLALAAMRRRR